ncbi:MAG TPA: hypothetical protein VK849_11160 [Longimicrobiales bacterium]|nr:hypothetical protein [Longimicrobiales bacterium]
MEARCTGCGGRVMPYHQYVTHFAPTATCATCGRQVRFRFFTRVLIVFVATATTFVVFAGLVDSVALELTVGAALFLLAILFDLWTYKNLVWDPVREERESSRSGHHVSVGQRPRG